MVHFFLLLIFSTFIFHLPDNKPLSQAPSLLPPRYAPSFFIAQRRHSAFPTLVDFQRCSRYNSRALALSASQFLHKKSSNEYVLVCSRGQFEPAQLALLSSCGVNLFPTPTNILFKLQMFCPHVGSAVLKRVNTFTAGNPFF